MAGFASFNELLSPAWVEKEYTELMPITVSESVYGNSYDYEVVTYTRDVFNPYFALEVLLLFFFLHALISLMFKAFYSRKR